MRTKKINRSHLVYGIVAVGPDNVIGLGAGMPWHSKRDFYHFKKTTTGHPCIFGKNTYQGLPKKPLPNRPNIVCSSSYKTGYVDGVFHSSSLEDALAACINNEKLFICGGAQMYKYALDHDLIDIMYVTEISDDALSEQIKSNPDAYTRFPYDIKTFFAMPKWKKESVVYRRQNLPAESGTTHAKFFRYLRVR